MHPIPIIISTTQKTWHRTWCHLASHMCSHKFTTWLAKCFAFVQFVTMKREKKKLQFSARVLKLKNEKKKENLCVRKKLLPCAHNTKAFSLRDRKKIEDGEKRRKIKKVFLFQFKTSWFIELEKLKEKRSWKMHEDCNDGVVIENKQDLKINFMRIEIEIKYIIQNKIECCEF